MTSRHVAAIGATFVAALLVVGCTSDDDADGATATAAPAVSASITAARTDSAGDTGISGDTGPTGGSDTTPTTVEQVIDVSTPPGGTGDFVGARTDVTDLGCVEGPAGWSASGTVANPTTDTVGYRIYVSFLDGAGATLGVVEVDVADVEPGEDRPWATEAAVTGAELECVLRVERFVL
jgi:hypothetical protein